MEIFKKASKLKLRFTTTVGVLSVEQLWDLSVQQLDKLAVSLEQKKEESTAKSFIKKTSETNPLAELRFLIVLEVLNTKVAENEKAVLRQQRKAEKEKLLQLIQDKKEGAMNQLSIEELEKRLNALETED